MSRRRPHPVPTLPSKPFRGRRMTQPRTPEDTVRVSAAWVVEQTLQTLAPSSEFLASALGRCAERDHGLLYELSLGTLRWLRRLDDVIAQASHRGFERIEPALRTPLRIATYQLLFLDRIPAHAAVKEGVEHARRLTHRGGASFTNAVLRKIARDPQLGAWPVRERDPVRRLAIERSHPDFLVRRWLECLGPDRTGALLDANNRPKPLHLLAFRDRGGRELLAEQLIDEGVAVEPSRISPLGLLVRGGNPLHGDCFRHGDFYVQDEASQVAALLPPVRPGERVLDAAAAPGGKSFAVAAAVPDARLLLADVSPGRIGVLRQNLRRLGRHLPVVAADAASLPFSATFDRVLLDLPCTGTGTLRKSPELKWRISEEEVGRLSRQALRLLRGGADRVAPGGYLVAVTCSLEPEENEEVIAALLAERPEFTPLPLEGLLDHPLELWIRGPGFWRLFTGGEHDGFTVHVLERRR